MQSCINQHILLPSAPWPVCDRTAQNSYFWAHGWTKFLPAKLSISSTFGYAAKATFFFSCCCSIATRMVFLFVPQTIAMLIQIEMFPWILMRRLIQQRNRRCRSSLKMCGICIPYSGTTKSTLGVCPRALEILKTNFWLCYNPVPRLIYWKHFLLQFPTGRQEKTSLCATESNNFHH